MHAVLSLTGSDYFSTGHLSGLSEGIFNSLPIILTGPLTYAMMSAGSLFLLRCGGYEKLFANISNLQSSSDEAKPLLRKVLSDGVCTVGLGAAIDCQQGLSPLYATNPRETTEAYSEIQIPVQLWYGSEDSTVPLSTAEWLDNILPNSTLNVRPVGHGLFFHHPVEVIESILQSTTSQ